MAGVCHLFLARVFRLHRLVGLLYLVLFAAQTYCIGTNTQPAVRALLTWLLPALGFTQACSPLRSMRVSLCPWRTLSRSLAARFADSARLDSVSNMSPGLRVSAWLCPSVPRSLVDPCAAPGAIVWWLGRWCRPD